MSVSRFSVSLILMHTILICHSNHSTAVLESPRASNCWVLGQYLDYCSDKYALFNQFPEECLSYFWDAIVVQNDFSVTHMFGKGGGVVLNELLQTEKDIYVSYEYIDIDNFFSTISDSPANNTNIITERNNLQAFLKPFQLVAGITVILEVTNDLTLPDNFSNNFITYFAILKKALPANMKIGLGLLSDYFQVITADPTNGIKFQNIDHLIDYYVVDATELNDDCTPGLISGGLSPISGKANYTMNKLEYDVISVGIPKKKLLYLISTNPSYSEDDTVCVQNYPEMCNYPNITKDWCADTLDTLYEKGKFCRKYANGFISSNLDIDDPHCNCECNTPFPAFYAILNGYKGASAPPNCPKFNRM